MQKLLAVLATLVIIITAMLGIASYLGLESANRYHLVFGLVSLVLVLMAGHLLYHGSGKR